MTDPVPKSVEAVFSKRECNQFVPSAKDSTRCYCGKAFTTHRTKGVNLDVKTDTWKPLIHTKLSPTDAYGTIDFQGGAHPSKAQYIRLAFDTRPENALHLLLKQWGLELPKLVISVHGGKANFELPPRLDRVLKKGVLKAAKTTGAWLLTSGTNTGVTRHVGDALSSERSPRLRSGRVVSIGIAPWGVVENRHLLIGNGKDVPYMSIDKPRSRLATLNNRHAYFLLVDDGTVCRYGAEYGLRRRLEKVISNQRLSSRTPCNVAMVCLVVEGGIHTIRMVLEYVTDKPPVPVVVIEGSGRAADLLAFACKYIPENGDSSLLDTLREQMTSTIMKTFAVGQDQARTLFVEILQCVKKKNLITIFHAEESGEGSGGDTEELDVAILTALFRARHLSAPEQLSLALAWNRIDLAQREIFTYGQSWPEGALEEAMMEALVNNRVEFVKLLLEKGVSMSRFLTIPRLEELYNSRAGPANTLRYLVADVRPHMSKNYQFTLVDIGLVINQLMGGTYRSSYSGRKFRAIYNQIVKRVAPIPVTNSCFPGLRSAHSSARFEAVAPESLDNDDVVFTFPFNDLLIWAVLTKRQSMAQLMWQHGEEALAKSLAATCLYKAMAKEAAEDDLEAEVCEELRKYAADFEHIALELVDYCYRQDDDMTQQLLTCALPNWGRQTCLYLAVVANLKSMLSHPSAQILLADLWMGGLRTRKSPNLKVVLGLLFPLIILKLGFKSKEELLLMPQTEEEHLYEIEEEEVESEAGSVLNLAKGNNSQDVKDFPNGKEIRDSHTYMFPRGFENHGEAHLDYFPEVPLEEKDQKQLRIRKKIYEFYGAPITKFWVHSLAYMVFLCFYTYTVLIRSLPEPEWNEYYVFIYLTTFGLEKVREIAANDAAKARKKIKVWANSAWNIGDALGILTFLVGFILRHEPRILGEARVFYSVNIVYWYVRILRILMVSKFLGPFVTLIGKFVYTMAYFVSLLCVFLLGYGVFRQSLLYPNNEPTWESARNMTFQPYFMIYGELFAEEIDSPCGEPGQDECVPGRWLNPIFMTAYLLMAIVLLLNMLIAIFNSIFIRTNAIAHQVWMFQRYSVVMDYEQRPSLPPPFIILSHIIIVAKWCHRRAKGQPGLFDGSLKLFLDDEGLERVRDFEEECMEDLSREKDTRNQLSAEEKIRSLLERQDRLQQRVEAVASIRPQIVDCLHRLEDLVLSVAQASDSSVPSCEEFKKSLPSDPKTSFALNESGDKSEVDTARIPAKELAKLNQIGEVARRVRYVSEMSFDDDSDESQDVQTGSDRSMHNSTGALSSLRMKHRHWSGASMNKPIPENGTLQTEETRSPSPRQPLTQMMSCPTSCEHRPERSMFSEHNFSTAGLDTLRGKSYDRVPAVNITNPTPGTSNFDLLRKAQFELRSLSDELGDNKSRLRVPFIHFPAIEPLRRMEVEAEAFHLKVAEGEGYHLLEGIIGKRLNSGSEEENQTEDLSASKTAQGRNETEEFEEPVVRKLTPDPLTGLSLPLDSTVLSIISTRPRRRTVSISMLQKQSSLISDSTELEELAMEALEQGLDETNSTLLSMRTCSERSDGKDNGFDY